MLGGVPLVAQLPAEIAAGEKLRLAVHDVSAEQVVLKVLPPQAAPVAVPLTVPIPLPDGRAAQVSVQARDEGAAAGASSDGALASVTVRYDSPELGALDLKLDLASGTIAATVRARIGEAADLADDRAQELRSALAEVTGREATVSVVPRHDPFVTYA